MKNANNREVHKEKSKSSIPQPRNDHFNIREDHFVCLPLHSYKQKDVDTLLCDVPR